MSAPGRGLAALMLVDRALGLVAGALMVLGAVAVTALMGVTVVAVFWRYVLHAPIFGIEDVSSMLLATVVASAVAWGARQGSHVSVNVIGFFAGRRATRITDLAVRLLGAGMTALAAWALLSIGSCGRPCGAMTNNLGIAHMPFYYLLAVGLGFYAALLAVQAAVGLVHWRGEDPNEVRD